MKYLLLLILTSTLWSCTSIISQSQAGITPVKLDEEKKQEWEGVWTGSAGLYTVKVIDAEKGNLLIGQLNDDGKKGEFKITNIKAQIRVYKDTHFINIKSSQLAPEGKVIPDEYKNSYTWIPYIMMESSIIFYYPNEKFFKDKKYIKKVTVGEDEYEKIMLDSQKLSELIDANINSAVEWKKPFMVLHKMQFE